MADVEVQCRRLFINPASDLLKYVRFFSAVNDYLVPREEPNYYQITIEIYIQREDRLIVEMYPKLRGLEGLLVYAYRY